MYLVRLRVLTNIARKRYFVKQDIPPFQDCKIPQSLERELDLSIEQFKKLKAYTPQSKIERIAKRPLVSQLLSWRYQPCGPALYNIPKK